MSEKDKAAVDQDGELDQKQDSAEPAQVVDQKAASSSPEGQVADQDDATPAEAADRPESESKPEDEGSPEDEGGEEPEFTVVIEEEAEEDSAQDLEDGEQELAEVTPGARIGDKLAEGDVPVPSSYPVLELRHVGLKANDKSNSAMTLEDVNLSFRVRRTHNLVAGSPDRLEALMALISGLRAPDEGSVLYRSTNIRQLESWDYRGHQLGVVFSQYALRDDLDAIENLVYTMDASGRTFLKPKDTLARELLEELHFPERLELRPASSLGRADYMRAAIARAVCCDADVLVCEEPMEGLEEQEEADLALLLKKLAKRHDCAVIVASQEKARVGTYDKTYRIGEA